MGKYTDKTCCFTGHRIIPPGEESKILIRVRHRLIPLIQSGVTYFGVGGALGFDTMMADLLLELKKENSRMRIIEVLPYEGYRAKWTPEQQLHAKNLDRQMDKIVYVSKEPSIIPGAQRSMSCSHPARICSIMSCSSRTSPLPMTISRWFPRINARKSSWTISCVYAACLLNLRFPA